jgi:hypothetical protein
MIHEATYQRRPSAGTGVEKTMAIVSANLCLQHGLEPPAGRANSQQRQTPVCSAGVSVTGFLNHQFLPLYAEGQYLLPDKGITEGVLNSLSFLAENYPVVPIDVTGKQYPYNILLTYWNVQSQLREMDADVELSILQDAGHKVKLATTQTAPRSYSLYYIPVLPLYRLLISRECKEAARLLLSVYAYLYHVTGIPYYRDVDSYLFYHYEIMEEWLNEEEQGHIDHEDLESNRNTLKTALQGGDVIGRILRDPVHLEQFEERVENAVCTTAFEKGCLELAETTLNLWRDHPQTNLFTHLPEVQEDDDDDENNWTGYGNTIYANEYIHFIADTESSIYDSIQQNIDAELNEKMYWQEHTLTSVYDCNFSPTADSLDYETRLFKLLDDLCDLLNKLP